MVETLVRAELAVVDVAVLFADPKGVYANLPGVDLWDEARDARLYAGPWPVVAHPPCARWSVPLCYVNQTRYGLKIGDDGGCFEFALAAVRAFGGVLEHPRDSVAWSRFELPRPRRGGWTTSFGDDGMSTVVDQYRYGHPAKKETWLYAIGCDPISFDWRPAPVGETALVSWLNPQIGRRRITKTEASRTPEAFRDVLLNMARSALAAVPVPDTRPEDSDV